MKLSISLPRAGELGEQKKIPEPIQALHDGLSKSQIESKESLIPPSLISDAPLEIESLAEGFSSGELLIQLTIDINGKPVHVRTLNSSLPRQVEGLIIARFMKAKYRPAQVNGINVQSTMDIAIQLGD